MTYGTLLIQHPSFKRELKKINSTLRYQLVRLLLAQDNCNPLKEEILGTDTSHSILCNYFTDKQ
jgi:hypothetical protein